ncbi:MAG: hypothetical protein QM765_09300 [Myxococcales bacterium]
MNNALLLSLIAATAIVPAVFAVDPDARRGLRRTLLVVAAFAALYLLMLTRLHVRLFLPE